MMALLTSFGEKAAVAVAQSATRLIQEGGAARTAGDKHWWKPCEVALFAYVRASHMMSTLAKKSMCTFSVTFPLLHS